MTPQAPQQPGANNPAAVAAQQQWLQQMMGGGQPAPAQQPRPQAPAQKPAAPAKDLPLMDQLPPVK